MADIHKLAYILWFKHKDSIDKSWLQVTRKSPMSLVFSHLSEHLESDAVPKRVYVIIQIELISSTDSFRLHFKEEYYNKPLLPVATYSWVWI